MVASRKDENPRANRRPARTSQGRENQAIDLAYEVAEQQMLSGNASAQVITHFLKLGTERERLEREKLGYEAELAKAKIEQLSSQVHAEELFAKAIEAFKGYQPSSEDEIV